MRLRGTHVWTALVGVLVIRRAERTRPLAVFALASVAIWGAKLYGVPGVSELGRLPVLVQTLIFIFGTPLLSLSLALLAGVGVHVIATVGVSKRIVAATALGAIALLAGVAAVHWSTVQSNGLRQMLPTLGMGANLSLHDAALLTGQLDRVGRGELGLLAAVGEYEQQMREI